jgi:histidinol phosphatase-like enzyme (inositol monophosphatase family)
MSDETSLLLEAVSDLARGAGDVAMRHFQKSILVDTKGDGSPVTIADRSGEEYSREWIRRRFPNDGIVGEEFGVEHGSSTRRWIIDPVDGTTSFVHGVPLWGTLIAVSESDEVLAGAAYFPALGEMIVAATGQGAWWNGARCHVSSVSSIDRATVLTTDHRVDRAPERVRGWRKLADRAAIARGWGDCYGYTLVATGRAEAMMDGALADWDTAALFPVIREAGGVFTDYAGRATPFGKSAVATNANLARDVRTILGVPYPAPLAS